MKAEAVPKQIDENTMEYQSCTVVIPSGTTIKIDYVEDKK